MRPNLSGPTLPTPSPDSIVFGDGSLFFEIGLPEGVTALTWDETTCPVFRQFTGGPPDQFVWDQYALDPGVAVAVTLDHKDPTACGIFSAQDCWMFAPREANGPGESNAVPPAVPDPIDSSVVTGGTLMLPGAFAMTTKFCPGCDLTNQEFVDVNFKDAYFAFADLRGSTIVNSPLDGASLYAATFGGSDEQATQLYKVSMDNAEAGNIRFELREGDVMAEVDFSQVEDFDCPRFSGGVFTEVIWPNPGSVPDNSDAWVIGACSDPVFASAVFDVDAFWPAHLWQVVKIEDSSVRIPDASLVPYLKQLNLSNLEFTGSRFIGLVPDLGATFDENGMVSARTNLSGAVLDGSRFSQVNLQAADLSGASLSAASFDGADLWQADLEKVSAANSIFSSARVWDATFTGATLTGASFAGADAHGAQFGSMTAPRVDFAGAYLFPGGTNGSTPVTFSGSDLTSANFSGALLGGAVFEGASTLLPDANFTGAQCISCNFTNASMVASGQGVDFQRSYIYGTTFSTSLKLADFTDATCCATIPPDQESLAWEFSAYVPDELGIEGPNVLYNGSDLDAADLAGAKCPDGSAAGASGCSGEQLSVTNPGRLGCVSAYVFTCPPTIDTRAGNGTRGYDPTDEFALSSPLGDPSSIAVTPEGSVIFADPSNHVVREITNVDSPDPILTTIAGNGTAGDTGDGGSAAAAQLSSPSGVSVRESDGAIAIADTFVNKVRLLEPDGTITTIAGDGFLCDPTVSCGDGGGATVAQLNQPTTVWFAPNDDLYIADTGSRRIRVVDADTSVITTVAGDGAACATTAVPACGDDGPATSAQLASPTGGLIGDEHGNVYISDTDTARVRVIDPTGNMQSFTAQGAFQTPAGVAIDAVGNRYIVDQGTNVVYRISAVGIPIPDLWAGTPGEACSDPTATVDACGDGGLAAHATFDAPTGMHADPGAPLSLWIADTGDQRIRHIASPF